MKRFVLGIVVICWITIVFAAGNGSKVTGILSGKTNKAPVEFATIALYEATTKKLVTGAMTDSTGCFHLEDVPTGRYYLVGSYVGYGETQSEMFTVGNGNQTVDVGVLWIDDKGQVLNEVVVAGRKSTFVPKLDRKVFNVGQDMIDIIEAVQLGTSIPHIDLERDIMVGMMLQFLLIFLVLSLALFIMMRFITHRLWLPFDDTLQKTEQFNLAQSVVPQFQKTEIKEFARLNNSLAKLMQKDKEIYRIQKEFTENASHELQTPISIIRSKLDLLMQEELDERSMNLVSDLYDLNTRMEHLNRNLLLLAKIENSQYTEMEEVDLGSFIRESMPTYNVLHSDLNISFLDQRTCHVVHNVNTILLSCLLNNLVVNAIRHTAAMNGEIRLLLCNSYFTVSNPADGVSLNARTLFQRFSSDDTKTSGNGLGLSIAKAICDYHGWRLQYVFEENHHVFSVHFR